MRDTMPQPKIETGTKLHEHLNTYGEVVWQDARKFYLRFAAVACVVSATLGGLLGFTVAGGFS